MDKVFTMAIVRKPCPEMINGLTTAGLGKPDYQKASEQHKQYIDALKECGLRVTLLDEDSNFPDSCFIEDIAVCTSHFAVITNPGAMTRNGEKHGIRQVLQEFYTAIEEIVHPGTLEAGDVMMVDQHCYIGISERTNHDGAGQLMTILRKYGMTGSKIPLKKMLHLKTGLSYLERNTLLVSGEFVDNPEFDRYHRIVVDEKEAYAANSLWINGQVLVPMGYPVTKKRIGDAGYLTIEVDVSEFQKLNGGLSCLSLRF